MRIGFVGYSGQEFDEVRARIKLNVIFAMIQGREEEYGEIEIVSGATNLGIHKMVYKMADMCGYKTVGIMCKEGYDYEIYPVDKLIVEGETWGDESETFLNYIDILYRVGGGNQSHKEVQMAREKGIEVKEYNI